MAQPVILQTAMIAAQAAATTTAAAVKLDGKADEEMLVELTRVAHAAQPSTATLHCCCRDWPAMHFAYVRARDKRHLGRRLA